MPFLAPAASLPPLRIAIVAGCAITAAAWLVPSSPPAPLVVAPAAVVAAPAVVAPAAVTEVPALPAALAPAVPSSELLFVFTAGDASYLRLAALQTPEAPDEDDGEDAAEDAAEHEDEDEQAPAEQARLDARIDAQDPADLDARPALAVPRHGRLHHVHDDDGVHAAIATVAARDVPAAYAAWQGRKVKVDNTCEATVIGFAVVARVSGEASWVDAPAWDAATVMAHGDRMLAAKLDRCTGTFARTATLPDIIIPTALDDAALEQAAIDALIASAPSQDTQREWDEQRGPGDDRRLLWHTQASIVADVLRHPGTGETFVSVHGHVLGGCGEREANVWGLFRVSDGALAPIELRQLGDIRGIDAVIDVEGDGELELLGKTWLGTAEVLIHANGDPIDELRVPFHGCAC